MLPLLFVLAASVAPPAKQPVVDQAWSILKDGVADHSSDRRAKAVHALGLMTKNRTAEQWGERALDDPSPTVRIAAAKALADMQAYGARPKLRSTLNDKDLRVVIAGADALYQLKDPAAYELFYALLTGERKGPSMMQSQLNTLKNRKELEKLAFETGIGFVPYGGMGYETWKRVTEDDTTPVRVAAEEKLATDPDAKTAAALAKSCSDSKWQIRAASAEAIAKRGDPALLDAVVPLLTDQNETVRTDAAAAVIHLTSRHARRSGK